MEKENALVSIITPTFNRGSFLEKNILSVKNQDYPFIEHIIIDGGSTDNSIDIIKKYDGTYNMTWISEKDNGYANALNKGFAMAKGDIVCWLDSDDFYLAGTIKKIVDIFLNHQNVDVVFGNILLSDQKGNIVDYIKHTDFDVSVLIYLTMNINPQAAFWFSKLHKKIGKLDESLRLHADADFFTRMGLLPATFYHTNDFLAVYRMHENQLSKGAEVARQEAHIRLQKYMEKDMNASKLAKKRTKLLIWRAFKFILQGDSWYVLVGLFRKIKKHYGPKLDA